MSNKYLMLNIYEPRRVTLNRKDDYASSGSGSGAVTTIPAIKVIVNNSLFKVLKGSTAQTALLDVDSNIKYLIDDSQINADSITANSGDIQKNKKEVDQLIVEMDGNTDDIAKLQRDIATLIQNLSELNSEVVNVINPDLEQLFEMIATNAGYTIVDEISAIPVPEGAKVIMQGNVFNWVKSVAYGLSETLALKPIDTLDYKIIEELAAGITFHISKDLPIVDIMLDDDGNKIGGSYDFINNYKALESVKSSNRIYSANQNAETKVEGVKDLRIRGIRLWNAANLPGNDATLTILGGINGKDEVGGFLVNLDDQPDYDNFTIPIGESRPLIWWFYQANVLKMGKITITRETADKYKITRTSSKYIQPLNDANRQIIDRTHINALYNSASAKPIHYDVLKILFEYDVVKAGTYLIDPFGNMIRGDITYHNFRPNDVIAGNYNLVLGDSVLGDYTKLGSAKDEDIEFNMQAGDGVFELFTMPDPALFSGKYCKLSLDKNNLPFYPVDEQRTFIDKWATEFENYPIDPLPADPDKYKFIVMTMVDSSEIIFHSNGDKWRLLSKTANVDLKLGTP